MRLSWRGFPIFAWFEASRILAERAHARRNRGVPRRRDPVPAVNRKAVHFNGERGRVVCNVQISLRIAAFASDSRRCAMQG
ncbi:hypothetical protein WJ23_15850 [Burkholderia lata]|nr:hypothetical protein WJ23_15850 [Burkholderia lata]